MDSINIYLKINKEDTNFIYSILEAHEGMAAVRTPEPISESLKATLQVMVSPDFMGEFEEVLKGLSSKIRIERVNS